MENLGIDGKLLFAQILNFFLFFFLIKKFVVKPFTAFINQEKTKDEEKNKFLENLKKREQDSIETEVKMKANMKKEFDSLFLQAKKEAQQLKSELIKKAEAEVVELKEKNIKSLEEKKASLYEEIKDKILNTSISIVDNSLKESLDKEMRKQVTSYIIKNYKGKLKINEN